MANASRGIRGIKTMARLSDGRRARTPAGALLELSSLANEKHLLGLELDRWTRRHVEIETRLNDIGEKERRLMAFVQDPTLAVASSPTTDFAGKSPAPAASPAPDRRFKVQEFSY